MKRKFLLVIICVLSCFTLSGCIDSKDVGNIANVKTTIINENNHDKKDIEKTFKIIKKKFNTMDFKDCELLSIEYSNDFDNQEKWLLKENKDYQEVIVLSFTFKTGKNPVQVFNTNSEYVYTAEFIKNKNNKWEMINWGQG